MKRKTALVLVGVMLCSLMGCGKKDVDYSGATESANGEVAVESQTTVAESIVIPENAEYTITGAKGTIEVAAEIKVPEDYERCTVMELSRVVYEDEDIKAMADKIFDEGSYFLYMPYNEEAKAFLRDKLTTASESAANDWDAKTFEYVLAKFDEEDFFAASDESFEELKFYPDHRTEEEVYFCDIFGAVDGRWYILSFQKDGNNCGYNLLRWDRFVGYQLGDYSPDSLEVRTMGNASTYTQEESEAMAMEFVKELGYEGYGLVQSNIAFFVSTLAENPEMVQRDESISGIDGYDVYLGRKYNNYSMAYSSDSWIMGYLYLDGTELKFDKYPVEKFENSECIRVYVDGQGICEMRVYNPMEEVGPMNDEIVFLPYDKVDSIAQDAMQSYADNNSGKIKIESIELAYGIVDENGKKALIPVWYYFGIDPLENEGFVRRDALIMINALDGAVIEYE